MKTYIGKIKWGLMYESLFTDGKKFFVKQYMCGSVVWSELTNDELKLYHVVTNN